MKYVIITLLMLACSFLVQASESHWQPFLLEDGLVKVPITLEEKEGYAIIDTGAMQSSINKAFISHHGLEKDILNYAKVTGIFGDKRRPRYKGVSFLMNGTNYQQNFLEVSFGPPRNAILLGTDFLSNVVLEIDYPNKKIRFFPNREEATVNNNVTLRKQRQTGYPIVLVGLNDEDNRWVVLDTGHSGGVLVEKSVATQNDWFRRFRSRAVLVKGVNGMGYHNTLTLPKISIGSFEVEKIEVAVPDNNKIKHLTSQYQQEHSRIRGRKVEGIMGYEALKHFRLMLDYRSGSIELSKP